MAVDVTPPDIEALWRPLTPAEAGTVAGRSASAWIRIKAVVPDIEARLEARLIDVATVKDVMVSMLLRVFKNPDGARSVSDAIDDRTESRTIDTALSTGEIYVSDAELLMLRPPIVPDVGMYVMGLGG